jgi:hypothetical protein
MLRKTETYLAGQLNICRPSGGQSDSEIRIEVIDKSSGCVAFEIRVPAKEMMEALTGYGFRSCTFDINTSGVIGKTREHKTEMVPIPQDAPYGDKGKEVIKAALKPFEVNGWKGRASDAENTMHRSRGVKDGFRMMEVTFERYI